MNIRGQQVHIDLGDDDEPQENPIPPRVVSFVGDVLERQAAATAPRPPAQKNTPQGFPSHKKRTTTSRFKAARNSDAVASRDEPSQPLQAAPANVTTPEGDEKRMIDAENRQRMQDMSEAEIQEERHELLENLSPALLQALLRRSKLDDGGNSETSFDAATEAAAASPEKPKQKGPPKRVTFEPALDEPIHDATVTTTDPSDATAPSPLPSTGSIHFPRPSQPPTLDPSSATFLSDLHDNYCPPLPHDPTKLAWMQPCATPSPYSPSAPALAPSDLRFAFTGALLPPATAARIPVSAGLHHHADAPDAAGYTVPELARLARSAVPAQRCVAFQTLGRVLYRLGRGEFGDPGRGDGLGELARGLWGEVERENVVGICTAESGGAGRHVAARAYATEAVWLWQKGGGRRWSTG